MPQIKKFNKTHTFRDSHFNKICNEERATLPAELRPKPKRPKKSPAIKSLKTQNFQNSMSI